MDFFRHFSEEGHHGFLEDIPVPINDKLIGGLGYVRVSGNIS